MDMCVDISLIGPISYIFLIHGALRYLLSSVLPRSFYFFRISLNEKRLSTQPLVAFHMQKTQFMNINIPELRTFSKCKVNSTLL